MYLSAAPLAVAHGVAASVGRMQTPPIAPDAVDDPTVADELIEEELLVEEISIDGMCGVY